MYVYIDNKSEAGVFTVGFYTPDGVWVPESDWPTRDEAAERVIELNGGGRRSSTVEYYPTPQGDKVAQAIKTFEENIGIITPMIADELKDIVATYPPGWFEEAVKRACEQNKRRLAYVKAILENWHRNGKDQLKHKPDTSGVQVIEG